MTNVVDEWRARRSDLEIEHARAIEAIESTCEDVYASWVDVMTSVKRRPGRIHGDGDGDDDENDYVDDDEWKTKTLKKARMKAQTELRALRRELIKHSKSHVERGRVREQCARMATFSTTSAFALRKLPTLDARLEASDEALDDEQFGKTLAMALEDDGEDGRGRTRGRTFSLWACSRALDDGAAFARALRRETTGVKSRGEWTFAMDVHVAYVEGNYARFFALVASERCSYANACALERHFSRVRSRALRAMNVALGGGTPMSGEELARILYMDDASEALALALACGLEVSERGVSFRVKAFEAPNFRDPDVEFALRTTTCSIVDRKLLPSTSALAIIRGENDSRSSLDDSRSLAPASRADVDVAAARRALDAARRALDAARDAALDADAL